MRRRRSIATCAAAAAVATLALATSAQAAVPRSFFGVDPQRPITADDYAQMQEARVGTLRIEAHWSGLNPAPGVFDWSSFDDQMRQASINNVEILPFVYSTPQWVAQREGRNCDPAECLPFAPHTGQGLSAFREFLAQFVGRYGRNGTFWTENPDLPRNPIEAVQIWNEQNSPTFYRPKPNVRRYAKLLDAANKAIGSADRSVDVILGGMFGTPFGDRNPDGITAWDFLRKLYRIRGAKKDFDAIAPHPYAKKMKLVRAQVDLLLDEVRDAGDRGVDMWITEIGWGSDKGANPLNRGRSGQAQRLDQAFSFFLDKRRAWNVKGVFWYSWRDNRIQGGGLCSWCPSSGLVEEDFTEKPSYRAFVRFTGGR
jgi:hypothetical protein